MARYRKIDVRMWGDERFRSLSAPSPNGRDCWIHLLTNRETTSIPGVYRAYEDTLARDLGWTVEGYREAFREVSREGMAEADWTVGLILIPNVIRHNPPENPNVIKSWRLAWDELPDCPLKTKAYHHLKAFVEGLSKGFQEAFAIAIPKGIRNQEQEQEQEEEERESASPPPVSPLAPQQSFALETSQADTKQPTGWRAQAERVLDVLNAARRRVRSSARDIRPSELSLKGIITCLKAGSTVDDCLHVIAVYEAEIRGGNTATLRYFDAVSPFRPENFSRALARDPGDPAQPPPRPAPNGMSDGGAARRDATLDPKVAERIEVLAKQKAVK